MEARFLAFLIIVPFILVFVYATWHEYRRFKSEGRSNYGLTYDRETNTTHVGAIAEDEESYNLDEFDPDLLEADATDQDNTATEDADSEAMADEDKRAAGIARNTDQPDTDQPHTDQPEKDVKPQDTRT